MFSPIMPSMLLIRGLILGFSIAAPVGPIGVLCIRRSIRNGWLSGFISGLGAASADMLYGGIAAFGLRAVSEFLISGQDWLRGFGGLFLIYLGIRTFVAKPAQKSAPDHEGNRASDYLSTFVLTVTNPLTILSFTAMFASIVPADIELTTSRSIQMVIGVFLGSSLWWIILSLSAGSLKSRLDDRLNQWIQWISGSIIGLFGIAAIWSLIA